jgi:hypothetical protein
VSDPIKFGSTITGYDADTVGSVVPRDEEEEEDDLYEEALLHTGDAVSPKSRGRTDHAIARTKSGGGAAQRTSRSKSGGAAKKYVPCGVEKNPNLGSPRSPTFGADLLQAPFQKLAPKRLDELFRGRNRANKEAGQAGEE